MRLGIRNVRAHLEQNVKVLLQLLPENDEPFFFLLDKFFILTLCFARQLTSSSGLLEAPDHIVVVAALPWLFWLILQIDGSSVGFSEGHFQPRHLWKVYLVGIRRWKIGT